MCFILHLNVIHRIVSLFFEAECINQQFHVKSFSSLIHSAFGDVENYSVKLMLDLILV